MFYRVAILSLLFVSLFGLNACDSAPPTLMKANFQFETDEKRDQHIAYMREHHMHALKHKRDETMYKGIRTEKHSLVACINCHVPESYNGKVLRHTDQEHFCTTCHTYVAAQLNCFECHVDHPMKTVVSMSAIPATTILSGTDVTKLSKQELIELAFTYSQNKSEIGKQLKSGGVSFKTNNQTDAINIDNKTDTNNNGGGVNE